MLGYTEQDIDNLIHEAAKFPLVIIDLFCGAGGTTSGAERAMFEGQKCCKVIYCINHDRYAILSHAENNPDCIHAIEDIRHADLRLPVYMVGQIRRLNPDVTVILWGSLECPHFSKAAGARKKNIESRTLGRTLYSKWDDKTKTHIKDEPYYIQAIKPDYIMIENVREFLTWGELDADGNPIPELKGYDFEDWKTTIEGLGYCYDHRFMNAADYGAFTSRDRYFGMFALPGLPLSFPEPSHNKKAANGLLKWKAVKEVLNFKDEGYTIFNRSTNPDVPKRQRKELSPKTYERVYAGLVKFIAHGDTSFISKYYAGSGSRALQNSSINEPCRTVTTENRHAIVQPNFIVQRHNGNPASKVSSVEAPARTLTQTGGNQDLITMRFLTDIPIVVKIKYFMAEYGIVDIKMRMLNIPELLRIQDFGDKYKLKGTATQKKKFIGNAVVPLVAQRWFEALTDGINKMLAAA